MKTIIGWIAKFVNHDKICVTTLQNVPYVKQVYTYCVAQNLYHTLKEIMIMNKNVKYTYWGWTTNRWDKKLPEP